MALARGGALLGDQLRQSRLQRQAVRVVGGQFRVEGLSQARHVADGGDRPHVVVVPLQPPGADRGVVHRPVQGQVQLHVPLPRVEHRPIAADAPLQQRVVGHVVGQGVPVRR